MPASFRLCVPLLASAFALLGTLTGCEGEVASSDASVDANVVRDAAVDLSETPDAEPECDADDECDDGVACTIDRCESGACVHRANFSVCDDGIFCNGVENCDFVNGCVPGVPRTCSDGELCTIDRCDEESKSCVYTPRDLDGDGEVDWHCPGGVDCDDRDPTRSSTSAEICGDRIDNDCDDMVDEADCGRAPHDVCEDALVIDASGAYEFSTDGARPDYRTGCSPDSYRDVVVALVLTEPSDVAIRASATSGSVGVGLRATCGDASPSIECNFGSPSVVRRRSLTAGTHYLVVATAGVQSVVLSVDLSPPTAAPANETCDAAIELPESGVVSGSFVDVSDDAVLACGFIGARDLFYRFTLNETRDVVVSALSPTGESVTVAVQQGCGGDVDPVVPVRCTGGTTAFTRIHSLAPGEYILAVEGPTFREVDFTLQLTLETPTAPIAGDSCDAPIPLELGVVFSDALVGAQDDGGATCASFTREKVYSFTLEQRANVAVTIEASRFLTSTVRAACVLGGPELRCDTASPVRHRLVDLDAGTYFVTVESTATPSFTILVEELPSTPPVPVADNDACGGAWTIPETGGAFSGTTTGLLNDLFASCGASAGSSDGFFRLALSGRKTVTAWLSAGEHDPVLTLQTGACGALSELGCDDDGGGSSGAMIEQTLDAGEYYFVVDGFGTSSFGPYVLEVYVRDP